MNVEDIVKTKKKMPLTQRTMIHLLLVSRKITEGIATALKPFEVSQQQFNVLRILRGQKGAPANLSTLNQRMVTKMSNTTRLVDKLIVKGYVERVVCASNRRKVEITITTEGQEALLQMDKVVEIAENNILAQLSKKDMEALNALLDKF